LVVITAGIVGICFGLLAGYKFKKFLCIKPFAVPAVIKVITIPPLIGMIIMGCVARNLFGELTVPFPDKWASVIRNILLANLLVRGGL
jgi:hypothetical protein